MNETFRVLIAEDIPLMRIMLAQYITGGGEKALGPALDGRTIEVFEVSNGVEATEALAAESFDLLFLDLVMPEKDGLTVLREVRSDPCHADLKVVVCTAVGERQVAEEAVEAGADAYLVKPCTLQSVTEKLRDIYTPETA